MRKIEAYKCSDGHIFESPRDAALHENYGQFRTSLDNWLDPLELSTLDRNKLRQRMEGPQGRVLKGILTNYFNIKGSDTDQNCTNYLIDN